MESIKVEGHPGLVRDTKTGAIVNDDTEAYQAFIQHRESKLALENKVKGLEEKLDLILQKLGISP